MKTPHTAKRLISAGAAALGAAHAGQGWRQSAQSGFGEKRLPAATLPVLQPILQAEIQAEIQAMVGVV